MESLPDGRGSGNRRWVSHMTADEFRAEVGRWCGSAVSVRWAARHYGRRRADDLIQNVAVRLLHYADRYRRTWHGSVILLFRVETRRQVGDEADYLRSAGRDMVSTFTDCDCELDPVANDPVANDDLPSGVRDAIDTLSACRRAAVADVLRTGVPPASADRSKYIVFYTAVRQIREQIGAPRTPGRRPAPCVLGKRLRTLLAA